MLSSPRPFEIACRTFVTAAARFRCFARKSRKVTASPRSSAKVAPAAVPLRKAEIRSRPAKLVVNDAKLWRSLFSSSECRRASCAARSSSPRRRSSSSRRRAATVSSSLDRRRRRSPSSLSRRMLKTFTCAAIAPMSQTISTSCESVRRVDRGLVVRAEYDCVRPFLTAGAAFGDDELGLSSQECFARPHHRTPSNTDDRLVSSCALRSRCTAGSDATSRVSGELLAATRTRCRPATPPPPPPPRLRGRSLLPAAAELVLSCD